MGEAVTDGTFTDDGPGRVYHPLVHGPPRGGEAGLDVQPVAHRGECSSAGIRYPSLAVRDRRVGSMVSSSRGVRSSSLTGVRSVTVFSTLRAARRVGENRRDRRGRFTHRTLGEAVQLWVAGSKTPSSTRAESWVSILAHVGTVKDAATWPTCQPWQPARNDQRVEDGLHTNVGDATSPVDLVLGERHPCSSGVDTLVMFMASSNQYLLYIGLSVANGSAPSPHRQMCTGMHCEALVEEGALCSGS